MFYSFSFSLALSLLPFLFLVALLQTKKAVRTMVCVGNTTQLESSAYQSERLRVTFRSEGLCAAKAPASFVWFAGLRCFHSPGGLQRAKQPHHVELQGGLRIFPLSVAVPNIYCETSSLLSNGLIQVSPPFHLPSMRGQQLPLAGPTAEQMGPEFAYTGRKQA